MLDLYTQIHTQIFDPDRIPYAIAAIFITLVAGMVTGPLGGNANPLFWIVIDGMFGGLGDRLDRLHRPKADLMLRGFGLTAVVLVVSVLIAKFLENMAVNYSFYGFSESLLLSFVLTSGTAWFALLRLYFAVEKDEVGKGAYYAISRSTRINLTSTDDFGINRVAMGYAARSFDKGLVAPIFWYLVGGLSVAFAYTCLAALAWRFGKSGFTKGFGAIPLALERLLGIVPSLLAAFLLTGASLFTPTAKLHKGIASWLGVGEGRASYDQGGYPVTSMTWALNVSLGGPVQDLGGSTMKAAWVGPEGATAQIDHKHLRRAIYISVIAHILFFATLFSTYLWAGKLLPS